MERVERLVWMLDGYIDGELVYECNEGRWSGRGRKSGCLSLERRLTGRCLDLHVERVSQKFLH